MVHDSAQTVLNIQNWINCSSKGVNKIKNWRIINFRKYHLENFLFNSKEMVIFTKYKLYYTLHRFCDGCWRRNVLVTTLTCWRRFDHFWYRNPLSFCKSIGHHVATNIQKLSPRSKFWHQHPVDTNFKSPTSLSRKLKLIR